MRAMATCWRTAAWCSTARPRHWARTRTSRSSISASPKAGASRSATASTTGGASAGWRSLTNMPNDHYDKLETRDPDDRERDFFVRLPDFIALALSAPGWANRLAGIEPYAVTSRAALARLPVLRKADLVAVQKESPPFGGLNVTAPARMRRLLMSPAPIFEPDCE